MTAAIEDATGLEVFPSPAAVGYQIGPMAGGIGNTADMIITLAERIEDIPAAFDLLANAWAVADITRRINARIRAWAASRGDRVQAGLTFPPLILQRLCKDHVRRTYHPRARLSADWYSLTMEFYGGSRSPAHPTGSEQYLIAIEARRRTYCYVLDGTARVTAHYVKDGKRDTGLAKPDLLSGGD